MSDIGLGRGGVGVCVEGERRKEGRGLYQSMDCGGSSLELEVLTVSTQPVGIKAKESV